MERLELRGTARVLACAVALLLAIRLDAQDGPRPNLESNIERPLRYRPEGRDFVIENGGERFNRPLYGGNTAFRVDAGDRPELALYLPGRGGNLRLGLRSDSGVLWLHEATRVTARYRPGQMLYEIRDPLLGSDAVFHLDVLALHQTEGLVVRATPAATTKGLELVAAYGGVSGERGRRDGDIGTESIPISEWFELRPEACAGNVIEVGREGFVLRSPAATIAGTLPEGARLDVADAGDWASLEKLLATPRGERIEHPVVVARVPLRAGEPLLFALQRVPAFPRADLPRVLAEAEAHLAALRERVRVETPDPFLDAAVAALNVAADAVWDEPQQVVLHGAVAWRSRLPGWRGPYAMDALGWHERARAHLAYWAGRQNTEPVPAALALPDESANLARSEAALHTNGDISNSHYDMNLVFIDALFRHLLWTGDLELARRVWPVIERHLAWERRSFRREYGPEKLPLYEAYAAIWASDDLQYHGGGTTHASAYNHWHNAMAARLARALGRDGSAYEREAGLIARAMRELLWMPERGAFAEFKDYLGEQLVHPSAGLWSFYQAIDSEVPTPEEASRMARELEARLPRIPVRGPGVPPGLHVLPTTDWMPYTWSANNVVLAENVHTALALWRAGRAEDAFRLTKASLLASMFMGICPGNVGSLSYLDVYRRESQRDFADGSGVLARAIVEGLFGVRPDALAGELVIRPGLPESWDRASLRHPDIALSYERTGRTERLRVELGFAKPLSLRLQLRARGESAAVAVNGQAVAGRPLDAAGRLEIASPPAPRLEIVVTWAGASPPTRPEAATGAHVTATADNGGAIDWRQALPAAARLEAIDLTPRFNDRVAEIFRPGKYRAPRSPFVSLAMPAQGIGAWAGHVQASAEIDDSGLRRVAAAAGGRLRLPNGVTFATPGPGPAPNVLFTSQWDNYPREASVLLHGKARRLFLLMAGSTNHMQSRLDNGEVVVAYEDGGSARLALHNPTNWWPIDQDYFIDDFQFRRPEAIPPRVALKTGEVRLLEAAAFKGEGGTVPGGAASVLVMPLDAEKELRALTVRALANEVVIGLLAATLER